MCMAVFIRQFGTGWLLSGIIDVLPESSYLVREPLQKSPNCGTDYNGKQAVNFMAVLTETKFTPAAINTLSNHVLYMCCIHFEMNLH